MDNTESWITGPPNRNFTWNHPSSNTCRRIEMPRDDRASFQACLRNQDNNTDPGALDGKPPGFVPDPLFESTLMTLAPEETSAYWIPITTGPGTPAALYKCRIGFDLESGQSFAVNVQINVHPLLINVIHSPVLTPPTTELRNRISCLK